MNLNRYEYYINACFGRSFDDQLKARLRVQAAMHGRSMEDEARDILRSALSSEAGRGSSLVDAIRARVEVFGGVDIELAPREPVRAPVDFHE